MRLAPVYKILIISYVSSDISDLIFYLSLGMISERSKHVIHRSQPKNCVLKAHSGVKKC
jgi:hypothetical protein